MSGQSARWGFYFSDLLVARRVLEHQLATARAEMNGTAPPGALVIAVESALPNSPRDWDIQELRHDGVFVIEEVKSGPIDAAARRVLWARIRNAVAAAPETPFVPRLTTNQTNPTLHPEFWRALPTQSGTTIPGNRLTRFESAEELAAEALYHLTSSDAQFNGTPPLAERRAREVLAAFEFVDSIGADELEHLVESLVDLFSKSLGGKQVCDALIGDLVRRAASPDPVLRQFSPEEICASVTLLADLSQFSASERRLWTNLKDASAPFEPSSGSNLAYQEWRTVQPGLASVLPSGSAWPSRLALIGRGGLGKTLTLGRIHCEAALLGPALWVSGSDLSGKDPREFAGALMVGAVATGATRAAPLSVFIDGFENAGSDSVELGKMLAAIATASMGVNVRVTISARASTWSSLAGSQQSVTGWTWCELNEWSAELVSALLVDSQRCSVAPELLRLLQTPFLLDLFLRTFGRDEQIPAGLQTRHAILNAYWDRRVLPTNGAGSAERRAELDKACEEEAHGRARHLLTGAAAATLVSEGVFILRRGLSIFRHALLRDFALLCWAVNRSAEGISVLSTLGTVAGPLVRWGALRAAIEAAVSPEEFNADFPKLHVLVSQRTLASTQAAIQVADVLGELEDPSLVDLPRMVRDCSPALDSRFVERVLIAATIARNPAWLAWLANLPEDSDWPNNETWVGVLFFGLVQNYLTVIAKGKGVTALARAVAKRLRSWSCSPKFAEALRSSEAHRWASLLPLVAAHVPEEATLDWVLANVGRNWGSRWGGLEALTLLIVEARIQNIVLPSYKTVSLYLEGSGLKATNDGIREDPSVAKYPNQDHQRTAVALLGEGAKAHRGLLHECPDIFLPVVFERLAGMARETAEEHEKRFSEHFPDVDFQPPTSEPKAQLDSRLAQAPVPNSPPDALGRIVDDVQPSLADHERDRIVQGLKSLLGELQLTPTGLREVYWRAAREGTSATALILLIECLVESYPHERDLLCEILSHQNLFQVPSAHACLHDAVAQVWPTLSEPQKQGVFGAIKQVATSPSFEGKYYVAPLLLAVPESERPIEFNYYFELFELRGLAPHIARDIPHRITYGSSALELAEQSPIVRPWLEMVKVATGHTAQTDDQFKEVIKSLVSALGELPDPSAAAQCPEAFIGVEKVLSADWHRNRGKASMISEADLRRIVGWCFAVIRANPPTALNEDCGEVEVESVPRTGFQHPFVLALKILDVVLVWECFENDRPALFQEVDKHFTGLSETLAWHFLRSIRAWHWLKFGPNTFWRLIEIIGNAPGVLSVALTHVAQAQPLPRRETIERWLTSASFFDGRSNQQVSKLSWNVGHLLGANYAAEPIGTNGGARELVHSLLCGRTGAFSAPEPRASFADGVTFGAKARLVELRPCEAVEVSRFGELCRAVWAELRQASEEQSNHVLYVTHPLRVALKVEGGVSSQALVWDAVEPILVEVIESGRVSVVYTLVFQLRDLGPVLGWPRLSTLVRALIVRVAASDLSEPAAPGHGWVMVLEHACELFEKLAIQTGVTVETSNLLYDALEVWGNRGIHKALETTYRLRTFPPS